MSSSTAKSKKVYANTSYRLEVSWDVDVDITAAKLSLRTKLAGVPLLGDWTLRLEKDKYCDVRASLEHGDGLPEGALGPEVTTKLAFGWIDSDGSYRGFNSAEFLDTMPEDAYCGRSLKFDSSDWEVAAAESSGRYHPATHRSYRFGVEMEHSYPSDKLEQLEAAPRKLALRTAGYQGQQLPHDVRLFFPNAHSDGAELWAKADVLTKSSSYFKDLLESDFAEAVPRRSKRARTEGVIEVSPPNGCSEDKDFDDSDDETDEFLFSKRRPTLEQSSEADDVSYRQITATQTAYSTYRAILVYLHTGYIHFAPLRSSSSSSSSRRAVLESAHADAPSLPLPISPKSAYRLSHLLGLSTLQKRCLDVFRSQVSVDNAAAELFSDTSIAYDDLRAIVRKFVKENWEEVKASDGWKECLQRIKAGEASTAAPVLAELLEQLA
ncbi:hypothetical protein JCM8097_008471 [Rhodosporidiobolus ruineniae]